jgi:hypothetical protein
MTMAMPEYLPFDQLVESWSTELGMAPGVLRAKLLTALEDGLRDESPARREESELELLWAPPALALGKGRRREAVRLEEFWHIADDYKYELEVGLRAAGRPVDVVAVAEAALGGRLLL